MEDHHLEEHDDDPGKDASVIREDRQIIETQANVSEQSYHEDEYDRQDRFIVHVVQVSQERGRIRVESPQANVPT